MSESTNLSLPYIAASQAQKHVTHNEALIKLDALVQLSAVTRTLAAPPAEPDDGARYLIASPASGDWQGRDSDIAAYQDQAWNFFIPKIGWRLWLMDEAKLVIFTGAGWTGLTGDFTSTSMLGISATADDTNRLAVSSSASLFNHAGAGHQLKLNKSDASQNATILSQILGEAITASPESDSDNFNPDGWDGDHPDKAVHVRLTPAKSIRLTGLAGGQSARLAVITNATSGIASDARLIILEHGSAGSLAANRFSFTDRMSRLLMPAETIALIYDAVDSRWIELVPARFAAVFEAYSDAHSTYDFTTQLSGTLASGQAGTYLATDTTQLPRGIYQLDTGTAATGRAHWGSAENSIVPAQGPALYVARLAVEALSTSAQRYQARAGWHDSQNSADVTDGVFWEHDDSVSAYWRLCASASGVRTKLSSSLLADTNYIYLGIFLNGDWSRADFFSSGNGQLWSFHEPLTGNLPAAVQPLSFSAGINKTIGAAQRNLNIDLQATRYDALRGS
jgi:uncharacterized protein DUF2793/uncharacterized protein with putative carbohydrate binding module